MGTSWEMVAYDGVLCTLLKDMEKGLNPWDAADIPVGPVIQLTMCTFADVDSA